MIQRYVTHKYIDHVYLCALVILEFTDCHLNNDGRVSSCFRAS
jgi:hypothetical protein